MDKRTLGVLEADYWQTPVAFQPAELCKINQLRAVLGMELVDSTLRVTGDSRPNTERKVKPVQIDHSAGRALYEQYLAKKVELEPHIAYADCIACATNGGSMTPVAPLATMGTGGGPLLCDHCGKPMILEGGKYNNLPVDRGWADNPDPKWRSFIAGGMVVQIVENGTLRIYHGYPNGGANYCCTKAYTLLEEQEKAFKCEFPPTAFVDIKNYLEAELGGDQSKHTREVFNLLYHFSPGIGVNRPTQELS